MNPWTHGGIHFPLPAATTNALLRDADPTVYYLLDYLIWSIGHYVGARLVAECAAAEVSGVTNAVMGSSSVDPAPYLAQTQLQFPALAVYRTQSEFTDRTITRRQDTSTLQVAYVLPPLTGGQAEQVAPILQAVKALLDRVIETGRDIAYAPPGGALGDSVYSPDFAGLTDAMVVRASFGAYPGTGELVFPAVMLTVQVLESADVDFSLLPPFTGATAHVNLRDANGDTPDASSAKVDIPLRIIAVSPTSGPRAGGDVLTLTTQSAKPGTTAMVGSRSATVLSVADDGLSMAIRAPKLPEHFPDNYPASIVLVGPDSQADRLPAAYTYVA